MLIAGRAGGNIRPGRLLEYRGGPAEGVYPSVMDIMGVPVHEIGGVDRAIPLTWPRVSPFSRSRSRGRRIRDEAPMVGPCAARVGERSGRSSWMS